MGAVACGGSRGDATHRGIEKGLNQDKKKLNHILRILLLGGPENGKSTFLKQVKIIHDIQLMPAFQIATHVIIIKNNVVSAAKLVLPYLEKKYLERNESFAKSAKFIDSEEEVNDPDWAKHLTVFTTDKQVSKLLAEGKINFAIDVGHFFPRVSTIFADDYTPTTEDLLRSRQVTTGVHEFEFKSDPNIVHFIDVGGQSSERRKWIHQFDKVDAILYFSALDAYSLPPSQPHPSYKTKLDEELHIWKSLLTLLPTTMNCVFIQNKSDLLTKILPSKPFHKFFPDFPEDKGTNFDYCCEFLQQKFAALHHKKSALSFQITNSLDRQITEKVFNHIRSQVINQVLDRFL